MITCITLADREHVRALVVAAQGGDREAFGQLVERYQRAVMATAMRRLGNFAEAQELCQEVFVQAMRKIDQLREPEAFGSWLRSIANRMAINRAVRRPPEVSVEPATMDAAADRETSPLAALVRDEQIDRLRKGMKRLRALDRKTLEAFYLQGRSVAEMSDQFASPVGTIKRRLHVARQRLARELEEPVAV